MKSRVCAPSNGNRRPVLSAAGRAAGRERLRQADADVAGLQPAGVCHRLQPVGGCLCSHPAPAGFSRACACRGCDDVYRHSGVNRRAQGRMLPVSHPMTARRWYGRPTQARLKPAESAGWAPAAHQLKLVAKAGRLKPTHREVCRPCRASDLKEDFTDLLAAFTELTTTFTSLTTRCADLTTGLTDLATAPTNMAPDPRIAIKSQPLGCGRRTSAPADLVTCSERPSSLTPLLPYSLTPFFQVP